MSARDDMMRRAMQNSEADGRTYGATFAATQKATESLVARGIFPIVQGATWSAVWDATEPAMWVAARIATNRCAREAQR